MKTKSKLRVQIYGTTDPRLKRAVAQLGEKLAPVLMKHLPDGVINIIFTTNRHITELNRRYLQRNRPTDVLSFSLPPPPILEGKKEKLLGEVYISREQARQQARAAGVGLQEELLRLVRHGLLHLAGLSHKEMDRLSS